MEEREGEAVRVGEEAASEQLQDGPLHVLLEHQVLQLELAPARKVEAQHAAEAAGGDLLLAARLIV